MTRLPAGLLPLLLTTVVAVAPAPAAAAPPRSAQAFIDAIARAEATVKASVPAQRKRVQEVDRRCLRQIGPDVPEAARDDALMLSFLPMIEQSLIVPLTAPLGRLVADLDAVPTRDRALRSLRAVWRAFYDALLRAPRRPGACEELAAWKAAGWAPAARPADIPDDPFAWLGDSSDSDTQARRQQAGIRRLRELGVPAREARRFDGERLFALLEPLTGDAVPSPR